MALTLTKAVAGSAPGRQPFQAASGKAVTPAPLATPTAGPLEPVQRGPATNTRPSATATAFHTIVRLRATWVRRGGEAGAACAANARTDAATATDRAAVFGVTERVGMVLLLVDGAKIAGRFSFGHGQYGMVAIHE